MKIPYRLLLTFIALTLSGCSTPEVPEPSKDGSYVIFSGESSARLLVVQGGTKFSSEGTYENLTGIPPKMGELSTSSISGVFKVSTATCGSYEFARSGRNFMVCTNCATGHPLRSGRSDCALEGRHMPLQWQPLGL